MDLLDYKRLADIYSYVIKTEKINGKLIFDRFYSAKEITITLSARVWNLNNWKNHKKYSVSLKIKNEEIKNYREKEIKKILLTKLYKQVIKKYL